MVRAENGNREDGAGALRDRDVEADTGGETDTDTDTDTDVAPMDRVDEGAVDGGEHSHAMVLQDSAAAEVWYVQIPLAFTLGA
jgi:hypothetical protein